MQTAEVSVKSSCGQRVEGYTHAGPHSSLVQSALPYQVPVPSETSPVLAMNGLPTDLGGSCFCLCPGIKREPPPGLAPKDQMTT